MADVRCSVCDTVCDDTLVLCSTCGNALPSKQAGFGASVPSGFGVLQKSGFGNPVQNGGDILQSGFGVQSQNVFGGGGQPQSGFGAQPQNSFNDIPAESFEVLPITAQPTGFGTTPPAVTPSGFGTMPPAAVIPSGFGAIPPAVAPKGFGATLPQPAGFGESTQSKDLSETSAGFNGMAAESARFADTVNGALSEEDSIYWTFKHCLFFLLKQFIPVYGIIILVMCALGNPKKYPKVITNYIRASLVYTTIVVVLVGIIMVVTAAMTAKMLGL